MPVLHRSCRALCEALWWSHGPTATRDLGWVPMPGNRRYNVVSGTISFSWNGFGLGFSNLAYKKESPSFVYDMKASFYELSYTIGQNWSLGLAVGLVGNGVGNIETSYARYETIKTSGAYYTGVLGGAIAGFEGLLGYQALQLKYSDLNNNADGSSLSTPFEIKGGLFLFGLGFHF